MEQEADFQGSVSCEAVWLQVGVVGERRGQRISLTFWCVMLYYLPCLGYFELPLFLRDKGY